MEPCVVVASACPSILPPEQIVKGILSTEELPEAEQVCEDVASYPWHIVTKYYDAHVRICSMAKKTLGSEQFAQSVNAVIICFDSQSDSGLETVEQWLSFLREFQAEIKILICDKCQPNPGPGVPLPNPSNSSLPTNGISKIQAQKWCVRNGFELVELNSSDLESEEDSELEDDFPESLGITRVVQALHAHLWPNLTLKDSHRAVHPMAGVGLEAGAGLQGLLNGLKGVSLSDEEEEEENGGSGRGHGKEILVAKVKPMPKSDSSNEAASPMQSVQPPSSPSPGPGIALGSFPKISPTCTGQLPAASSHGHSQPIAIVPPVPILPQATPSTTDLPAPLASHSTNGEGASAAEAAESQSAASAAPRRDQRIDSVLEAMDGMSEDSFEELFLNLSAMKSKASNLSPTQRKAYAEQMTLAFWHSIGGHEDEVDLSDEQDLVE